ncbi:MAG: cation:proton antiporter [Chloroflexi bacterium]|nr:cation:proton antiporter [Chloroflexota bacterium]
MELEASLRAAAAVAAGAAISQIAGRRLSIPVPVMLLTLGIFAGPEGAGVIDPGAIQTVVEVVVVLSVALIVFEGGTALNWRLLRVMGPVVRNLVVLGLVVTPVAGMLASHFILDFPWRVAALFGALVSVTGPSVITPLLRAVKVNDRIRVGLMGEGIIIDPFGALLTLFLLQLALSESINPAGPTSWVIERVVTGIVVGAAGALAVAGIPRVVHRLSSREMSLLVVGGAVVGFAVAESLAHEAGLTAMVVMGIALGNLHLPHREAMDDFQEHVTAFLVAAVYVLLAAEIDLGELRDLGVRGLVLTAVLAFVARPLIVTIATLRSDLAIRERIFLALVGPRGVVAASLAGVVAVEAGGKLGVSEAEFVAAVFVVIAATISVQSAYAGPLARVLKVYPLTTVIAGADDAGRRLAGKLVAAGETVLLIEADEGAALRAREEGFEVILGDPGSAEVLRRARVGEANAFVVALGSDDRSLLAAHLARAKFGCRRVVARVDDPANFGVFEEAGVLVVNPNEALASELAGVLAGAPTLDALAVPEDNLEATRVTVANPDAQTTLDRCEALSGVLVMLVRRAGRGFLPTAKTQIQIGDQLTLFGPSASVASARQKLSLGGHPSSE